MVLDKIYEAKAKLGQLTDTLDFTGITHVDNQPAISQEQLMHAIAQLGNQYTQVPPVYSALKFQGRRLSSIARKARILPEALQAIAAEKSKTVLIYECCLVSYEPPFFTIKAHVSHGTYIRSLVNDIAVLAGSCATTHALRRLAIGPFSVDQAIKLGDFRTIQDIKNNLISVNEMTSKIALIQEK